MNWKHVIYTVGLMSLIATGSHYLAKTLYSQTLATNTRVPVTITKELRSPGREVVQYLEAFKSDGSKAVAYAGSAGEGAVRHEIVDVVSRTVTLLDSNVAAYTTQGVRRSFLSRATTFSRRCEEAFAQPTVDVRCEAVPEKILGKTVVRVSFHTIDSRIGTRIDREFLVSPELNFLPLREKRWVNGALAEEREVVSLQVGDPAPVWFAVPAHFQKLDKVSQLIVLSAAHRGVPIDDQHYLSNLDKKWERENEAIRRGE